jgi:hypothetical protein
MQISVFRSRIAVSGCKIGFPDPGFMAGLSECEKIYHILFLSERMEYYKFVTQNGEFCRRLFRAPMV